MKNNRLIALLVVCGVLDWWMLSSHRATARHIPQEQVIEVQEQPVIKVAKHDVKKRSKTVTAHSRQVRVC